MRDFLLVLSLAAVGYLAYDDYSKRAALKDTQRQLQELSASNAQVLQKSGQPTLKPLPVFKPTPPVWFQDRVHEGSSLDGARQHTQEKERSDSETRRP